MEGLEDDALLLGCDTDAGILHGEGHDVVGLGKDRMIRAPALAGQADAHFDLALGGEFDGVGQQVLENLLQALGVAVHGVRQVRVELNMKRQILGLGHMPEVAIDVVAQATEGYFLDFHRNSAGLDFGQIENVVNEVEQVRTRGVDVARELDLLGGQVAGRVTGQLLAENKY